MNKSKKKIAADKFSLRSYLKELSSVERFILFGVKTEMIEDEWDKLDSHQQVDLMQRYVVNEEYIRKVLIYAPEASLTILQSISSQIPLEQNTINNGYWYLNYNFMIYRIDSYPNPNKRKQIKSTYILFDEIAEVLYAIKEKTVELGRSLVQPLISRINPCLNFYGIFEPANLIKIYRSHFFWKEDILTDEQLNSYITEYSLLCPYFSFIDGRIVNLCNLINMDDYEKLAHGIKYKKLYIPKEDELMMYGKEDYFEETPQYLALKDLLISTFGLEPAAAMVFILHITMDFNYGAKPFEINDLYDDLFLEDYNIETKNRLYITVTDYYNHYRSWIHRGHTPKELSLSVKPVIIDENADQLRFDFYDKNSSIDWDQDIPFTDGEDPWSNSDDPIGEYKAFFDDDDELYKPKKKDEIEFVVQPVISNAPKIGRNDPCPCGSGKKYKKCCGAVSN